MSVANVPALVRYSVDILLINPPCVGVDRPSLGLHILQAIAREEGLSCKIHYSNLRLAALMGEVSYTSVAYSPPLELHGERIFKHLFQASSAPVETLFFSDTSPVRSSQQAQKLVSNIGNETEIRTSVDAWSKEFEELLYQTDAKVFGVSTTFAQTLSALHLVKLIRRVRPEAKIILGGANCDGVMGAAISLIQPDVDHVFSGESEDTFRKFCSELRNGSTSTARLERGAPTKNLDSIPIPDFDDFFDELDVSLPESELRNSGQIFIPYETSRGCWWGERSHCTFCGLNANGMWFRVKSADKALRELQQLAKKYPVKKIAISDNIMPLSYFKTLVPALEAARLDVEIFYEQKSNLKRHQVKSLKAAGISKIQPGIEALSSSLLKRMKKGVSAAQNLRLLKWAKIYGVNLTWNLLYGFPGESAEDYRETLILLADLVHLSPPNGFSKVSFDRFSPYFDHPDQFGIKNVRAHENYLLAFPSGWPVQDLAYHFVGDCITLDRIDDSLRSEISRAVDKWIGLWRNTESPALAVIELDEETYLLIDTRHAPHAEIVSQEFARAVVGESSEAVGDVVEALDRRCAVRVDGRVIGLATATPDVYENLIGIELASERLGELYKCDGDYIDVRTGNSDE